MGMMIAGYYLPAAMAGIYVKVDANGVYHFTNVPTTSGYRLFIGDRSSKTSKRALVAYTKDPAQFEHLIKRYAKQFGVDPNLVRAIIQAESGFDPFATSIKGAQGLMQLMPETAKDLSVQDAYDPEENIRAGVRYLKQMLEKFKGNLSLAVAAFNAGPRAVQQYGTIPPYKETKNYVKKVLTYYHLYR